ncbi:MAG: hypothetical protein JRG86_01810 [Deltaproteobacteria bacterium]|jgi:outer membrane protein OmpA-like peptidoglycan-associated protein|nr:hypothetical protein [Deltaproteobacteria bacterium]
MPTRFARRAVAAAARDRSENPNGFGDWWAAVAIFFLAGMGLLAVIGGATRPEAPSVDAGPEVLAALAPAEQSLSEIEQGFARLCQEPVLLALELEPDCRTGILTLPDAFFEGFGGAQLKGELQQDVSDAMTTYLATLRSLPAIWESLEALEIRGHTDPRAVRDPYWTNLVGSQQRALGALLYLIGSQRMSVADKEDLRRLATVSGASFSRPPASCPAESRDCYPQWRRVEILPILSESARRAGWSRTIEDVRGALERARAANVAGSP